VADKAEEKSATPVIGPVLKPGQIKASDDDEPPWWRFYAVWGGVAAIGLIVLGIVSLVGRNTPPKPPLQHEPPKAPTALDLDDLPQDTLAQPVRLPGAGVVPAEQKSKPAKVAIGRGRKPGGEPLPKVEGPAEPEKKKPSGAIIYQPRGPI